jgi:glycosyltransferase involved in cell wall biosynthesis
MKISIIIPTYNRPEGLKLLLASISAQIEICNSIEIVVIDNSMNPLESVKDVCDLSGLKTSNLHLIHQPNPGVSNARNAGILQSKGKWLIFVDDDEEMGVDYLKVALELINCNDPMTIYGGQYIPILEPGGPAWVKDSYYYVGYGENAHPLKESDYLLGGNLIISRILLNKIGAFNPELGHSRHQASYGEDTELCMRALSAGAEQFYDPKLFIFHHIPLFRMSIDRIKEQRRKSARFKAIAHLKHITTPKAFLSRLALKSYFMRVVLKESIIIAGNTIKNLFRDKKLYPYWQNYLIEHTLLHYSRLHINLQIYRMISLVK